MAIRIWNIFLLFFQNAIRSQLSTLSFEELQKLKEKVGAKVYREALFGTKDKNSNVKKLFKRENKNRPREMSAKKPVRLIAAVPKVVQKEIRDPRWAKSSNTLDHLNLTKTFAIFTIVITITCMITLILT